MLKNISIWFYAFSKSLLKRPAFLLMLAFLPILSFGISAYGRSQEPLLAVALYNEGNTSAAQETIDALLQHEGSVCFYEAADEKQLIKDTASSYAECGYRFTKDYTTEHLLDINQLKDSIHVVHSPGSMLSGSINELVFSCYFRIYCQELLKDYLSRPGVLKQSASLSQAVKDASELYQQHCGDGSIFSIEIANPDTQNPEIASKKIHGIKEDFLTRMCRGMISVWIMLAALSGGCRLAADRRSALFLPLPPAQRPFIQLQEILAPALLSAVSGMAALCFLPAHQNLLLEFSALLAYALLLSLLAYAVSCLPAAESFLPAVMPFVLLGALVFAPVFLDLSVYVKALAVPKYLFVNSFYLELFL